MNEREGKIKGERMRESVREKESKRAKEIMHKRKRERA